MFRTVITTAFLLLVTILSPARANELEAQAFREYLAEAKAGDPTAQFVVARRYEKGLGTEQSSDKAMHWYKQAADNGHPLAKLFVERRQAADQPKPEPKPEPARIAKPEPKPKPAPVKPKKAKPVPVARTYDTEQVISSGNWLTGKQPVGFLPSIRSSCLPSSDELICFSEKFRHTVNNQELVYTIKSTVNNFQPDGSFSVKYVYNVLDINKAGGERSYAPKIAAKEGWQEPGISFQCRLNDNNAAVCKGSAGTVTVTQ
ncbi:MAG: sel1 repeat family protein [Gammaproteobacteria bacterium]|nr:sel1 repeat family protein [Gammaproteobacteria bacterium]